jgi:hypothetical protein
MARDEGGDPLLDHQFTAGNYCCGVLEVAIKKTAEKISV